MNKPKIYKLIDSSGNLYYSTAKGTIGGHSGLKIYGRLDCPSAHRYITKGQYIQHRVFFIDETTAISAGYRPCAVCMRDKYLIWKKQEKESTK